MPNISLVKSATHAKAIEERDHFLSRHPELASLQREIDDRLKKASTGHNRLVVIHDLMMQSLKELDGKLQALVRRYRSRSS